MPHPSEHHSPSRPLDDEEAQELAEAMRVFGTASRLRLMWAMLDSERTVGELSQSTGIAQSAVSQQLRLLRHGRLVAARRHGRHVHYRLHDQHVADLLAAIRHHYEHVHPSEPAHPPSEAVLARRKR